MITQEIITICVIGLSNVLIVALMCRMAVKTQLSGGESKEIVLKRMEDKKSRRTPQKVADPERIFSN